MLNDRDHKLAGELSEALFIKKSIADQIVVSGIPGLDREAAFEFVQKSKEVTKAIQDLGSERTALQELIRAQDFEEDL